MQIVWTHWGNTGDFSLKVHTSCHGTPQSTGYIYSAWSGHSEAQTPSWIVAGTLSPLSAIAFAVTKKEPSLFNINVAVYFYLKLLDYSGFWTTQE